MPEPTDRLQQRKKCFGPQRTLTRIWSSSTVLGVYPWKVRPWTFHLSKWSHDPRHPISHVALLNANSWKWTRTSAELRAPHIIGKVRQEQKEEEIMIIYLLAVGVIGLISRTVVFSLNIRPSFQKKVASRTLSGRLLEGQD